MPYTQALETWLTLPDLSPEDRARLEACRHDPQALEDTFGHPLSFGTAGLRGTMGPGPSHMNPYTVAWATAGLAESLQDLGHKGGPIVIARDSRHDSDTFAQVAARVLHAYGFTPHYWQDPTPTPALSWSVRSLQALGGIMITASHNPSHYNGYKVYNHTGGQILSDQAQAISRKSQAYLSGQKTLPNLAPFSLLIEEGQGQILGPDSLNAYLQTVYERARPFVHHQEVPVRVVFSPLHGTGSPAGPLLLRRAGFEVLEVPGQGDWDGDFPTVTKPNPEDPAAFALAEDLGRAHQADLLLLTDPDADRLGAAIASDQGYTLLSGNQMAALMIDFLTTSLQREEGLVLTSTVSSPFAKVLARSRGLKVRETLTGFKYIADLMTHPDPADPPFLFGFEESYGFLFGTHARDKDALMAALVMASCFRQAKAQGLSLLDRLADLYATTGYFEDRLHNVDLASLGGRQAGLDLLDQIRSQPPTEVAGTPVLVIKDYAPGLGQLPKENLLQFDLADGSVLALRPSGTEPLLKFYINARGLDKTQAHERANMYIQAFNKRLWKS